MSRPRDARVKARLLSLGSVALDPTLEWTCSVPTAGPGAGMPSVFFRFGGHRVRLSVDPDSPLRLVADGDEAMLVESNEVVARGRLEPVACHCPRQVYVNISESCAFRCAFCPVPLQPPRVKGVDEVVAMVERSLDTIDAISITSGVARSPEDDLPHILNVVRALRRYGLPIGVSVYPCDGCSARLKEAGAVEVKYNLEAADPGLFRRLCPGLDRDYIWASLRDAVGVFGRNRVYTNILLGLGESDDAVRAEVERLASAGVIPILRPFQPHPRLKAVGTRPSAERLLAMAGHARRALEAHGLDLRRSLTMCGACTGCDVAPQVDL